MTDKIIFRIFILSIATIIVVLFIFLRKIDTNIRFEENSMPIPSYEQGLWDGFNKTMKYLNDHDYLTKDSIKIEITELDSVLHSK